MKGVTQYEDTLRVHNFAAVCGLLYRETLEVNYSFKVQGGSNMTGTDLCVNKPHCAAAVRL